MRIHDDRGRIIEITSITVEIIVLLAPHAGIIILNPISFLLACIGL